MVPTNKQPSLAQTHTAAAAAAAAADSGKEKNISTYAQAHPHLLESIFLRDNLSEFLHLCFFPNGYFYNKETAAAATIATTTTVSAHKLIIS